MRLGLVATALYSFFIIYSADAGRFLNLVQQVENEEQRLTASFGKFERDLLKALLPPTCGAKDGEQSDKEFLCYQVFGYSIDSFGSSFTYHLAEQRPLETFEYQFTKRRPLQMCEFFWNKWDSNKSKRSDLDVCGDSSEDVYEESYPQHSIRFMEEVNKPAYVLASEDEKEIFLAKAKIIQAEVGGYCCGDNSDCLTRFGSAEAYICEPPSDIDANDECTKKQGSADTYLWVKLSPYVLKDGRAWHTTNSTIYHEFGHICSFVWAEQFSRDSTKTPLVRAGALRSIDDTYDNDNKKYCEFNDEMKAFYTELMNQQMSNSNLTQCAIKIAEQRKSDCDVACVSSNMEEIFAEMTYHLNDVKAIRFYPEIVPNEYCTIPGDKEHPIWTDVLECMLSHSGKFRARLIEEMGCSDWVEKGLAK